MNRTVTDLITKEGKKNEQPKQDKFGSLEDYLNKVCQDTFVQTVREEKLLLDPAVKSRGEKR